VDDTTKWSHDLSRGHKKNIKKAEWEKKEKEKRRKKEDPVPRVWLWF
jgi:hypothetical protein